MGTRTAPTQAEEESTRAFLHAHGIRVAAAAMDPMLEEAIVRLVRTLYPDSPRKDLAQLESAALERGGFGLDSRPPGPDPLASTAAEYAALLKTSLTVTEAARRLGVSAANLRDQLGRRPPRLYGVRLRSGWRIPIFQFDGGRLLPGLAEVVRNLDPELHPVSVYRWFVTPNVDLAEHTSRKAPATPLEWLRRGKPPATIAELATHL